MVRLALETRHTQASQPHLGDSLAFLLAMRKASRLLQLQVSSFLPNKNERENKHMSHRRATSGQNRKQKTNHTKDLDFARHNERTSRVRRVRVPTRAGLASNNNNNNSNSSQRSLRAWIKNEALFCEGGSQQMRSERDKEHPRASSFSRHSLQTSTQAQKQEPTPISRKKKRVQQYT